MESHATISNEVVARYAADAALDVDGVRALVERQLPRQRGVRVDDDGGRTRVELHVEIEWGARIADVGIEVQRRVREYVERMTDVQVAAVDVVVDEVSAP